MFLDQAAGIVIDLLVALSLIALATAGAMLAASARAEVQRRLGTIGVQRAIGATSGHVTRVHALEAALVAAPAGAVGCAAGLLAIYGPSAQLLTLLNEPAPGSALVLPLIGHLAGGGGARRRRGRMAGLASGGPTRRLAAARRRHHARAAPAAPAARGALPSGLTTLGVRLVAARRARLVATAITLGLSTAFVLLMLVLSSALSALETDPTTLGKRYELTAALPRGAAPSGAPDPRGAGRRAAL